MAENSEARETGSFEALTIEDSLKQLQTSLSMGLTSTEVGYRLGRFGRNEIAEKHQNVAVAFLKRFWGLTAWMLEVAILLSYVLGKYVDSYIIAALLLVNAVLGFVQEQQATKAVKALKQRLRLKARVLRDGVWRSVDAAEIVPGDIVRIRLGDVVPADLKVVEAEATVDQSAITGESLPVEKKAGEIVYSGSVVKKGEVTAVVVATGSHTYFGKTVELVQLAKPRLHIEEVISDLMKWLLLIVISLLFAAVFVSWFKGIDLLSVLPLALVLLVSAIPVALPTMFTITMALGSVELAKKGVLVTRLSASEDAALMDVLCTDKTGTITQNKLIITEILELDGYRKEDVLLFGALASQKANQDPIDMAFFEAASERGIGLDVYVQKKFLPFDPATRRTEAFVEKEGEVLRVAKGAVSAIMQMCYPEGEVPEDVSSKAEALANRGYRVIAVAVGNGNVMSLAGFIAIYDKPRPDSATLIGKLRSLGVSVKMLTGDSLPIAKQIAREINLGEKISRIKDIKRTEHEDAVLAADAVEASDGFAEIYPEDKYRIVKALQAGGHVVGMTGDGINDAAALKQAEVGIAVSNATDVAKGSASVVLTREGLSNIVDLVITGRMIYQRILTWILNKIVKTFQVVFFVIIAFMLTGLYVVDTFQIVLLLFLVDFVTISLSTDNVRPSSKPEKWKIASFVKTSAVLAVLVIAESLALLYLGMTLLGLDNASKLHTFTFDILLFGGLSVLFVVRERGSFWKSKPSMPLLIAIIVDILVSFVISVVGIPGITPLPAQVVGLTLAWSLLFNLLVNDLVKTMLLPVHD